MHWIRVSQSIPALKPCVKSTVRWRVPAARPNPRNSSSLRSWARSSKTPWRNARERTASCESNTFIDQTSPGELCFDGWVSVSVTFIRFPLKLQRWNWRPVTVWLNRVHSSCRLSALSAHLKSTPALTWPKDPKKTRWRGEPSSHTHISVCDPLCRIQPKVYKSSSEITSIKVWLQAFIYLWHGLTW